MESNLFPKRKLCPYCNESLTLPVFKKHKDLYYDVKTKRWTARASDWTMSSIENLDRNDDMIISGTYIYARGISNNYISKGVSRDTPYITVLHTVHFHEMPVPGSRVTMGVLIINL